VNIVIISDLNIAGQPTALMRAINKYTDHKARCIIAQDDHFAYDKDIILSEETYEEAIEIVKKADFFHFGRGIFNWPGIEFTKKILNPRNCCVKYYGSELRGNFKQINEFHEKTGITAITGTDWSITGRLPNSIYHLGSYFTKFGDMEADELPWRDDLDKIRICAGSAGHPLKGYNFLQSTVSQLVEEGYPIELGVMVGLSNDICLKEKEKFNVTFTSLHGAWGISGVESMFLGHVVMSCLDPWIMSLYPDNPTYIINRKTLKDRLIQLVEMDFKDRHILSQNTRNFALENFSTWTILKRYLYLFDLIMDREAYLDGGKNPKIIYDFF